MIGSADRDPDRLAAPDQLESGARAGTWRSEPVCTTASGAPLARLVAPVALQALLEFAPGIELDGEPQWQTDPYLRAVTSLPLALTGGGR